MPSTGPAGSNMSSTLLGRDAGDAEGADGGDRRGGRADRGGGPQERRRSRRHSTNSTTTPTAIGTIRRAADSPATSSRSMGSTSRDSILRGPVAAETPLVGAGFATGGGASTSRSVAS